MFRLRIKPITTIILATCIVLIGVVTTSAMGLWKTESSKIPVKFDQEEYSEQYNPADIRGSYTFAEISKLFNIPIEDLATAFLVEESVASEFKCKELELIFADAPNEIGTGSVRMFVAFYLGLPYELTEDVYLLDVAEKLLNEKSSITEEQASYLNTHTFTFVQP